MLQLQVLRQNAEVVKEKLAVKNFYDLSLVDKILEQDEELRKLKTETETLQAELNAASKEIGVLMGKGEKEKASEKKMVVAKNKTVIQQQNEKLSQLESLLNDNLVLLPNLPSEKVPRGKTPADNISIKEGGKTTIASRFCSTLGIN